MARQFPAPGSGVPGAPPALQRALTSRDGLFVEPCDQPASTAPDASDSVPAIDVVSPTPADRFARGYLPAAGFLVAAAVIEGLTRWAGLRPRQRSGTSSSRSPKETS